MIIGFRICGIGEAFFKDGNPADNHDKCAPDEPREEQYFDKVHRYNHQRVSHCMRQLSPFRNVKEEYWNRVE